MLFRTMGKASNNSPSRSLLTSRGKASKRRSNCWYVLTALLALSAFTSAEAETGYVSQAPVDRGGRLAFAFEPTPYKWGASTNVFKVVSVPDHSPLSGAISSGDFIYAVNGVSINSAQQLLAAVSSNAPGSKVAVDFLDTESNYRAFRTTATAVSIGQANQFHLTSSSSENGAKSASPTSFCDNNPIVCLLGVAVGVAVVGSALGSSANSSENWGTSSSKCEPYYRYYTDGDGFTRGVLTGC